MDPGRLPRSPNLAILLPVNKESTWKIEYSEKYLHARNPTQEDKRASEHGLSKGVLGSVDRTRFAPEIF